MLTPPGDPGYRSDLPKLESERRPVGYRRGLQLEDRLQGLGAVALGLVGLLVVYGIYTGFCHRVCRRLPHRHRACWCRCRR